MKNRIAATVVGLLTLSVVLGAAAFTPSETVQEVQQVSAAVATNTPYNVTPLQAERRQFIEDMDAKLGGFHVFSCSGQGKLVVDIDKWNSLSVTDQESAAAVSLAYVSWAPKDAPIGDESLIVLDLDSDTQIGTYDKSGYASL